MKIKAEFPHGVVIMTHDLMKTVYPVEIASPRSLRYALSEGGAMGPIFVVTRHPGAIEWLARQGYDATPIAHLDPADLRPRDTVVGAVPAHVAAEVCARGARYMHLAMDVPPDRRGDDLTAAEMDAFGARLTELVVSPAPRPGGVARLRRRRRRSSRCPPPQGDAQHVGSRRRDNRFASAGRHAFKASDDGRPAQYFR